MEANLSGKKYELMALFSPDLTEKERDEALKVVSDLLLSKQGKVVAEKAWGMRDLAYSIKKKTRGYYHLWHFVQDGENIAEIERELTLDGNILRHMITAIKPTEELVIFPDEDSKKPAKREKKGVDEEESKSHETKDKAKEVSPRPSRKKDQGEEGKDGAVGSVDEAKLNKIIDGSDISL